MMMMKSVFWWRKPEYPEETTNLRQVIDETFHTHGKKERKERTDTPGQNQKVFPLVGIRNKFDYNYYSYYSAI